MNNARTANIEMIKTVARKIAPMIEKVAFLGGATTGLLITDPAAVEIRPTLDVDIIVEILSRTEYYKLEDTLKSLGFKQSMKKDDPICRWLTGYIILDVMPTNEEILGFSNMWYSEALRNSVYIEIAKNFNVRVVTAPYFLATKIEAFYGRGKNDFLCSHDMEDIISIIDGRTELLDEIKKASNTLRQFLAENFNKFLHNNAFIESISGNLLPDTASQARRPILVKRIENIIKLHP